MPKRRDGFSAAPLKADSCIVVFHEVWGLVDHTKDVCKRLSKLGFAARAPDLYAGHEGILTPENIQRAMKGVWDLSLEDRRDKVKVARALEEKSLGKEVREVVSVLYDQGFRDELLKNALESIDEAREEFDAVASLGFSLGGALSLLCATRSTHLKAAAAFYGEPPAARDVARISIPVLAVYAEHDEIINGGVPQFVDAMLGNGKDLTFKTYPNTKHGFFNDTRPAVYDRAAADDSWRILRWFFERNL